MAEESAKPAKKDDNVIFVGKKPAMSYVLAAMTQFSSGADEIHVKARGKSISRAVDVVEVLKNKFMNDVKYNIDIGTDKVNDEKKGELRVSTISLSLKK